MTGREKPEYIDFTLFPGLTRLSRPSVLHDEDLAHAIVDRILERGRTLTLDGPSMRTRHLGLDDPTTSEASHQPARTAGEEVIRISGIELPEFPEPTVAEMQARIVEGERP